MTFYLPIMPGPYSKLLPRDYFPEYWLMTREEIVGDIIDAQLEPLPARILEINEAAGTAVDVTKAIAVAVYDRLSEDPYEDLGEWFDKHGIEWRDEYADERSDYAEHNTQSRVYHW